MIDPDKYRWLKIEPVDAWFFRDGRPSIRGEDQSDIESEFPPNPTTVVGALRAALARANGWSGSGSWSDEASELKQTLGDGFDDLGKLVFLGPFLSKEFEQNGGERRLELLWPLPQHVVGRSMDGSFIPEGLMQPSRELICCDVSTDGIRLPEVGTNQTSPSDASEQRKPPSHPDDIYVTTTGFNAILSGERPKPEECIPACDLYVHESRVGIRRDAETRTTASGDIYSPRYLRLKRGVSLVHAVSGVPEQWNWPTIMPLGGESRLATVERLDQVPELPTARSGNAAVAIALTPTRFEPDWWGAGPGEPAKTLSMELGGQVTCVALDRPRLIGGWDFKTNAPRPLVPFAPAGTVWWLEKDATDSPGLTQVGSHSAYGYGLVALSTVSQ
ncbi:MAG: type III-B CRISPR module-associated Cmr3 family protein [Candidatus Paceibacterota bacterium]